MTARVFFRPTVGISIRVRFGWETSAPRAGVLAGNFSSLIQRQFSRGAAGLLALMPRLCLSSLSLDFVPLSPYTFLPFSLSPSYFSPLSPCLFSAARFITWPKYRRKKSIHSTNFRPPSLSLFLSPKTLLHAYIFIYIFVYDIISPLPQNDFSSNINKLEYHYYIFIAI